MVTMVDIVNMVVDKTKITTIQLFKETKAKLDQLINNKSETYDDIIKRLISIYETKHAEKLENEFTKGYNAVKRKMR